MTQSVSLLQCVAPHFLLYEFLLSDTRSVYHNALNLNVFLFHPERDKIVENITKLASVLDDIREEIDQPIFITSGFRCASVNSYYKGAKNSFHLVGRAADLKYSSLLYETIMEHRSKFKEVILNYSKGYIHVSI